MKSNISPTIEWAMLSGCGIPKHILAGSTVHHANGDSHCDCPRATIWVDLADGHLGYPAGLIPRLLHGTPALRAELQIIPSGLHWEELDEDISIAGLSAGCGDRTLFRKRAA